MQKLGIMTQDTIFVVPLILKTTLLLALFELGFCQPGPHSNLAVSSQMTMTLSKGILMVEVFTNLQKFFMASSLC